jgi:integrase/recombinase XerD
LLVLNATRPHIELYRAAMEARGLAASTIDRRLSTVCGFYRFAHIDGRIASNPAQYVRRPKVQPSEGHGMDCAELGTFLFTAERFDRDHAALAVLLGLNGLRVSEACGTNIEDLAVQRGHRTLRIVGKGNKPATIPLVPRTARTIDLCVGERHEGPIVRRKDGQRLDRRTAHRWVRSIGKRAGLGVVHPHMLRAGFIMAALDAGVPLRDVQIAARHVDPRTTTIYDRRRENFDRHAALDMPWWFCAGRVFLRGFLMPGELPEGCDYSAGLRLRDEWRVAVRTHLAETPIRTGARTRDHFAAWAACGPSRAQIQAGGQGIPRRSGRRPRGMPRRLIGAE